MKTKVGICSCLGNGSASSQNIAGIASSQFFGLDVVEGKCYYNELGDLETFEDCPAKSNDMVELSELRGGKYKLTYNKKTVYFKKSINDGVISLIKF